VVANPGVALEFLLELLDPQPSIAATMTVAAEASRERRE
jgi:hypothetical protein